MPISGQTCFRWFLQNSDQSETGQPIVGRADFGSIRIRFLTVELSHNLHFFHSGEVFVKNRKIAAGAAVCPLDLCHQKGGIISGDKKINLSAVFCHQIMELNLLAVTILKIVGFFQQGAGRQIFQSYA